MNGIEPLSKAYESFVLPLNYTGDKTTPRIYLISRILERRVRLYFYMKKRGFKFVGSTICYAFMQGIGMVNDHLISCHCYGKTKRLAKP